MPETLTVLIAEDSATDLLLLSTIVRRQGHHVLTASNGAEAVQVFARDRPQLVLMDALMPVMDGFEAARQIKQLAGEALVPIIFLTSCVRVKPWRAAWMPAATTFWPSPTTRSSWRRRSTPWTACAGCRPRSSSSAT